MLANKYHKNIIDFYNYLNKLIFEHVCLYIEAVLIWNWLKAWVSMLDIDYVLGGKLHVCLFFH